MDRLLINIPRTEFSRKVRRHKRKVAAGIALAAAGGFLAGYGVNEAGARTDRSLAEVQLQRERTGYVAYRNKILSEIREARRLSVQRPRRAFPSGRPVFGPLPRGSSTRAKIRRVREVRRRFARRALPVLIVWRQTVPPLSARDRFEADQIVRCEAGQDDDLDGRIEVPEEIRWSIDSTFDGGFQFHPGTWRSALRIAGLRGPRFAYQAKPVLQYRVAIAWRNAIGGWAPAGRETQGWPVCGRGL